MRLGVFTDVHGNLGNLRAVMKHMSVMGCDQRLCLGDVIDVKISKKVAVSGWLDPDLVADNVHELASLVAECELLTGNQEERFAALTQPATRPASAHRLVEAERRYRMGDTLFMHGHDREWLHLHDDVWYPDVSDTEERIVLHGHRHRRQLLRSEATKGGPRLYQQLDVTLGVPVDLGDCRFHHLVDVGPVFLDASWLLFEEDCGPRVTWFCADASEFSQSTARCSPELQTR